MNRRTLRVPGPGTTGLLILTTRPEIAADPAPSAPPARRSNPRSRLAADYPNPSPHRVARENACVPRISAFYGIVIWMYHDEIHHLGRPHFHARYGDDEASVEIGTSEVLAGGLPPRALRLVTDWASEHRDELQDNWDRARRHEPLRRIEPLR